MFSYQTSTTLARLCNDIQVTFVIVEQLYNTGNLNPSSKNTIGKRIGYCANATERKT